MQGPIPFKLLVGPLIAACAFAMPASAQPPPPDLVLTNGKIITVDEQFSIAEAVAIRGTRIAAVGTSEQITALAGAGTRSIDLGGRAVIPGLIDNHMHLLRAGPTWRREVRLDGVDRRDRALDLLRARAEAIEPGAWIVTLGGFTVDQFADDDSAFTRAELDRVAPDNPVLLQASYYRGYANTRALEAFDLLDDPAPWLMLDADGRPSEEIDARGIRTLAARVPAPSHAEAEASTQAMLSDLNRFGLTAVGSVGCPSELLAPYRARAAGGRLRLRVFCIDGPRAGTPGQVDRILPRIAELEMLRGDDRVDTIAFGEGVYAPLHDSMFSADTPLTPGNLAQWRRIVGEVARAGLPLHVHANFRATLGAFLDQIERVHAEHPVTSLRWAFAHANQLEAAHLERMKELGMYAAVHPWAVINGGINRRAFGDEALDMPPLRTIEDSGITWGFGSDGTRANQVLPFTTLAFAVTGEMVGGERVLRRTISREEALIAHTRNNAYLIFREDELGSIEPGKLADLVVLDGDYLTVPASEIASITPLMTLVDGRVVHDAGL